MSDQDARQVLKDIEAHSKPQSCKYCYLIWAAVYAALPITMIICGILERV